MNLKADRVSDEEIKDAIREGWTQMQIIKKLKTHSQRVNQIRGMMENRKIIKKQYEQDSFILNAY